MTFPISEELSDSDDVGTTGRMTIDHGMGWPCHVMWKTKPFFGLPRQ
jgi:hypothetical protein